MSRSRTYVPKHRGRAEPTLRKGLRKGVLFSGVAVAGTGLAVSSGVVLRDADPETSAAALTLADQTGLQTTESTAPTEDRTVAVSRSDRRTTVDAAKVRALSQESGGQVTRSMDLGSGDPRQVAEAMLAEFGWRSDQFGCLDSLWTRESNWRTTAANASSGAYGIPQALPGSKMASAGADWQLNPETQIRWGLGYIQGRYGSPCGAWGHSLSHGWY